MQLMESAILKNKRSNNPIFHLRVTECSRNTFEIQFVYGTDAESTVVKELRFWFSDYSVVRISFFVEATLRKRKGERIPIFIPSVALGSGQGVWEVWWRALCYSHKPKKTERRCRHAKDAVEKGHCFNPTSRCQPLVPLANTSAPLYECKAHAANACIVRLKVLCDEFICVC